MSLIEFATDVRQLVPISPTRSLNSITASARCAGGDATALYDAIYLGSRDLAKKQGRKVLVLVSDGGDTAKSTTYAEALEQALRSRSHDLLHHRCAHRGQRRPRPGRRTRADHAGGADRRQELLRRPKAGSTRPLNKVSDDLRTQYLLGYYPHDQELGRNFHRVQVTVPRAAADAFNIRYRSRLLRRSARRAAAQASRLTGSLACAVSANSAFSDL